MKENGQATVELLAILIGFVAVILGMVVICGMCMSETRYFLSARNNAEIAAQNTDAGTVGGSEYKSWEGCSLGIFSEGTTVHFSAKDQLVRTSDNMATPSLNALTDTSTSQPQSAMPQYHRLSSWLAPYSYDSSIFAEDVTSRISNFNALDLAQLVRRSGDDSISAIETLSADSQAGPHSSRDANTKLQESYSLLFGVKISADRHRNNAANEVFMPVMTKKRLP